MSDLSEFLLARIAEDEAVDPEWGFPLNVALHRTDCLEFGAVDRSEARCDCGVPERYLAECDAKRRIVESEIRREVGPVSHYVSSEVHAQIAARTATPVMRFLALPYADHPDYRQEWRP